MERKALLIGVSEYRDPKLARLRKPEADVTSLARVLANPDMGGFAVRSLTNCLKGEAEKAITQLCRNRSPDDIILFYFSGHGVRDAECHLYLAISDTQSDDLLSSALAGYWIRLVLDRSLAQTQVVVLDCCHSGAFSADAKASIGESVGTSDAFGSGGKGRIILTASDSTAYAWESGVLKGTSENSLFTQYLVAGIETGEADTNYDCEIDTDELYKYVYDQVRQERPEQQPLKFGDRQRGNIVIAKAPLRVLPLPEYIREAVENPLPNVRMSIIETLENRVQHGKPGEAVSAYATLRRLAADDSNSVSLVATAALKRHPKPRGYTEEQLTSSLPSIVGGTFPVNSQSGVETTSESDHAPPISELAVSPSGLLKTEADSQSEPLGEYQRDSPVIAQRQAVNSTGPADDLTGDILAESVNLGDPINVSLLDRLIDTSPQRYDEDPSSEVAELRLIKQGLHRDVKQLLNTAMADISTDFHDSVVSILTYGVPKWLTVDISSPAQQQRIAKAFQEALQHFEPRLKSISVSPIPAETPYESVRFLIEGKTQLRMGVAMVSFIATIDSGEIDLKFSTERDRFGRPA